MASEKGISICHDVSFEAASDLSAKQYYCVEATDTANRIDIGDGASATYGTLGVLQNAPVQYGEAQVRMFGPSKAVCAATAASFGCWLTRNASGQLEVTTTGSLAVGWALETPDASASSIIDVFLFPFLCQLTSNHA